MTRKHPLLKVFAIIMIVVAAIFTVAFGLVQGLLSAGASYLNEIAAEANVSITEANAAIGAAQTALIFMIISGIVMLLTGIVGLASKNKKVIMVFGIICLVFAVIYLIMSIIGEAFAGNAYIPIIYLILPIGYLCGCMLSKQ